MMVLVSYDVSTIDAAGRKRLRHVAKTCVNFGIRVQNSVFECNVDQAQWVKLRAKLTDIYEPETDSLRFYFLGDNYQKRIEHLGAKPAIDVEEPIVI
ncbi:MAG: CRISPR-associated endonuclease Cas2 [Lentisphaerae bacterium]|nr:CRISPR-associated endonuclease Cas2 [Lentisphaerota bacterium]OQC15982.1 MAG: CRISPR-associated endonuclease Cas2 [Lentisphaerae bacterium ADurb.Bin082]HQL86826.1 CRISPR-associated endonuclease Cas2 [Lentisphaeria bacterium]